MNIKNVLWDNGKCNNFKCLDIHFLAVVTIGKTENHYFNVLDSGAMVYLLGRVLINFDIHNNHVT